MAAAAARSDRGHHRHREHSAAAAAVEEQGGVEAPQLYVYICIYIYIVFKRVASLRGGCPLQKNEVAAARPVAKPQLR